VSTAEYLTPAVPTTAANECDAALAPHQAASQRDPALAPADAANHAPLATLLTAFATLTDEVVALRAEVRALRAPMGRLLSLREAARVLGVSRNRTLPVLIREGRVRVVTVNGKPKIPADEVERISREGTGAFTPSRAKRPAARSQAPLARDLA
jgi:hypothetical protein